MEDKELYDRMCKKISQLTRVIFVLNTKNDENEGLVDSLVDAYEKEIESITREANSMLNKMQKNVEKMKESTNVEEKVNSIRKKCDENIISFSNEYDKFKKESTSKLNKINADFDEKIDRLKNDFLRVGRRLCEYRCGCCDSGEVLLLSLGFGFAYILYANF